MIENKIIYGFNDIQVATLTDNGYEEYIPIAGAISCKVNSNQEYKFAYAGKKAIRFDGELTSDGVLQVTGLTLDEEQLLFGYDRLEDGTLAIGNTRCPILKLTFSRQVRNGKKRIYEFPYVRFRVGGFESNTLGENFDIDTLEIQFDASVDDKGKIYYIKEVDN